MSHSYDFTSENFIPEFIGTALLDTIGLVIPSIDEGLKEKMGLSQDIRSLGLLSSRTGAAGQILAIDEAVKATSCRIVSIELPRDTKGWGGHGNFIIIGASTVSDARRGIELALELTNKYAGELYISDAGHLEFAFSARAGEALELGFNARRDMAFGFFCGSPAAIGLVMADYALKSAQVEILSYASPTKGTSHSNEVIVTVFGKASAVKTSVITARTIGLSLLNSMGSEAKSPSVPYLTE